MLRPTLAATLLATGCLSTNEIRGHWAIRSDGRDGACMPGEQVYVEVADEEADWYACTAGGFSASVWGDNHAFDIDFTLDSGTSQLLDTVGHAHVALDRINGDFDLGLVTFERD